MKKENDRQSMEAKATPEMIREIRESAATDIQALEVARSKVDELRTKQKGYTERIESLKLELHNVFNTTEDVEAAIKRRNDIQNEISENEKIMAGIVDHFLPAAEKAAHDAAANIVSVFLRISSAAKEKSQSQLDELLDQAGLIISRFGNDLSETIQSIFGGDWTPYIAPGTAQKLKQFNLSRAPQDVSQNYAAIALANMYRR